MTDKDKLDTLKSHSNGDVAQVVAAFAQRSDVSIDDILSLTAQLMPLFQGTQTALPTQVTAEVPVTLAAPAIKPALPIENAVTDDKVFCLCCGRGFTMLKRHLKAEHGLTEDEYRTMFNLPETFQLVAPNYSERKAAYAKQVGLGKYSREAGAEEAPRAT